MPGTIIITGGGRGIGAATSLLAASQGYRVCVNYHRDRSAAERVAGDIVNKGGQALAVAADVANARDVRGMFDRVDRLAHGIPLQRGGKRKRSRGRSCGCCPMRRATQLAQRST